MNDNAIRGLRRELDTIVKTIRENPDRAGSDIINQAVYALENARMWLGESLVEMGFQTPYSKSLDPTTEQIAPETDQGTPTDDYYPSDGSYIRFIKELRATLVHAAEKVRGELSTGSKKEYYRLALRTAYCYIAQARMWMGKELSDIHKENLDTL